MCGYRRLVWTKHADLGMDFVFVTVNLPVKSSEVDIELY
jgi:hypothetical protein